MITLSLQLIFNEIDLGIPWRYANNVLLNANNLEELLENYVRNSIESCSIQNLTYLVRWMLIHTPALSHVNYVTIGRAVCPDDKKFYPYTLHKINDFYIPNEDSPQNLFFFSFLFQFVWKCFLWLFLNEFQSTVFIPIFFGFQSIWASKSYFHLLKMILKMRMKVCAPKSHKMNKTTEKVE